MIWEGVELYNVAELVPSPHATGVELPRSVNRQKTCPYCHPLYYLLSTIRS